MFLSHIYCKSVFLHLLKVFNPVEVNRLEMKKSIQDSRLAFHLHTAWDKTKGGNSRDSIGKYILKKPKLSQLASWAPLFAAARLGSKTLFATKYFARELCQKHCLSNIAPPQDGILHNFLYGGGGGSMPIFVVRNFTLHQYLGSVNYNINENSIFWVHKSEKGRIVEFYEGLQNIRACSYRQSFPGIFLFRRENRSAEVIFTFHMRKVFVT